MADQPPKPEGVYLFGSDGKIYTADPGNLTDITDKAEGVHGFGIKAEDFGGNVEAQDEPDVEGHDLDSYGYWHRYWKWGWIYDAYGDLCYAYHYHPYATGFCIYRA